MYDKNNEVKVRNLIKALQMFPMGASVICVDDSSGRESLITYINYDEETNQVILVTGD
jgi:hypothetical protein